MTEVMSTSKAHNALEVHAGSCMAFLRGMYGLAVWLWLLLSLKLWLRELLL